MLFFPLHRLVNDRRKLWIELHDGLRRIRRHRRDLDGQFGKTGGRERQRSRHRVIHHHAYGIEIRPNIEGFHTNLLGRHVIGGAHEHAGARLRVVGSCSRELGDAKVQNLHEIGLVLTVYQVHVVRLQVAMNDLCCMRGG